MPRAINEVGNRYGKLTVIRRVEPPEKYYKRYSFFLCRCDCGNEKIIRGSHLRDGYTQSCRRCLPKGEASFNGLYAERKKAAQRRKIDWNLSKEYFRQITSQPCYYCGELPHQIILGDGCNGEYVYNGIDRVDNELGYVEGNCVPCCGTCNYAKRVLNVNYFQTWVKKVYNHWASKS